MIKYTELCESPSSVDSFSKLILLSAEAIAISGRKILITRNIKAIIITGVLLKTFINL
jgi:hypothetical protein